MGEKREEEVWPIKPKNPDFGQGNGSRIGKRKRTFIYICHRENVVKM